jgi:hypothetical protein
MRTPSRAGIITSRTRSTSWAIGEPSYALISVFSTARLLGCSAARLLGSACRSGLPGQAGAAGGAL